jgi:disulfide bond formation protein DsbB
MRDALYVLIAVGVIAFFIVRQRRSDRFRERSLLFPLLLGIYGAVELTRISEHDSLTTASVVLLCSSAVASLAFGVIRGRTIELFVRGDELWERASWTTIGVGWGGLVVTRVALIAVASAVGAKVASSPASIPIMLAITLAAQMLVVDVRARDMGVAVARPRRP